MKCPLFLFSLPRSGSTLLQTVLSGHAHIASTAEPWLLLPFIYTLKKNGQASEYSHTSAFLAFKDFISKMEGQKETYFHCLRDFSLSLYQYCCPNDETYFLDKTPRYYLILPEILQLFPDAKFIFLFRNPIHIYSSTMQTWGFNRFKYLAKSHIDLTTGPGLLSRGYQLFHKKAYALNYEDFVISPETHLREISDYLNLPYDPNLLTRLNENRLHGHMGDPALNTGNIDTGSLEKWHATFNTPFRKKIIASYIRQLGADTVAIQGYDQGELLKSIELMPGKTSITCARDMVDYLLYRIIQTMNLNLWMAKRFRWIYGTVLS